jgi:hypothetical protein
MTPRLRALLMAGMLAGAALAPSAGHARDFPYCLQGDNYGYPGDCSFSSYQQCLATAAGLLDSCGVNPRFAYLRPDVVPRRHRAGRYRGGEAR